MQRDSRFFFPSIGSKDAPGFLFKIVHNYLSVIAYEGYQNIPLQNTMVGVQDMLPQNMLLWHINYFELYTLETAKTGRDFP